MKHENKVVEELIQILTNYNKWRRGNESVEMPSPEKIGECIDRVVELLSSREMNVSTENGWVVVASDGRICEFTWSRLRTDAIRTWCLWWVKPKDWRGHKRRGYKCVKAKRIIRINE